MTARRDGGEDETDRRQRVHRANVALNSPVLIGTWSRHRPAIAADLETIRRGLWELNEPRFDDVVADLMLAARVIDDWLSRNPLDPAQRPGDVGFREWNDEVYDRLQAIGRRLDRALRDEAGLFLVQ